MIKKSLLVNLCLIFTLFPFVSPYPLASDMQPVAAILGFSLFIIDLMNRTATLFKSELVFLFFCIWYCFYLGTKGDFLIEDRFTIFLGFCVYYAISRNIKLIKIKTIYLCIIFNFLSALWNILSPASFISIANFIVRKIKVTSFETRGITGLSAESSFIAVMAITHLLAYFFFSRTQSTSKNKTMIVVFITIAIIFLSKSASGFMIAVSLSIVNFFIILSKFDMRRIYLFGGLIMSISLITLYYTEPLNIRGINLVMLFVEDPVALLTESSLQERLVGLHVGIIAITQYPLGTGAGSYLTTAQQLDSVFSISSIYPLARSGVASNVSALGTGLTEFGILFPLAFISLAFRGISSGRDSATLLSMALLMLMFSFSVGFPLTYLMIALANNNYTKKNS
jgi:hypothetical protein